MSDGFDAMIASARDFFAGLALNNTRDWFEPNKARFKDQIEAPAKLIVSLWAEDISRLTGVSHVGKLGRIHRDTRFSADKTPYNPYLHAYWQGGPAVSGWLFRLTAEGPEMMTGLHDLDPPALARFRAAVDRDGDALVAALDSARAAGCTLVEMGPEPLKRVPKPYAPDHPQGDLLRRKGLALGCRLPPQALAGGLLPAMTATASTMLPVWRWCAAAMRG